MEQGRNMNINFNTTHSEDGRKFNIEPVKEYIRKNSKV